MIKGAWLWNDRERTYYTQTNNAVETLLKAKDGRGWLESCGPTAFIMAVAALGIKPEIARAGRYSPQPEDIATLYLNDTSNADRFRAARPNLVPGSIPGNRVPQYYPAAAADLYYLPAKYHDSLGFDAVAQLVSEGRPVQLCLVDPGHYIIAVAYDDEREELIYNDPWPGRFVDGNGFNVRMSRAEYQANTKLFCVAYGPKEE